MTRLSSTSEGDMSFQRLTNAVLGQRADAQSWCCGPQLAGERPHRTQVCPPEAREHLQVALDIRHQLSYGVHLVSVFTGGWFTLAAQTFWVFQFSVKCEGQADAQTHFHWAPQTRVDSSGGSQLASQVFSYGCKSVCMVHRKTRYQRVFPCLDLTVELVSNLLQYLIKSHSDAALFSPEIKFHFKY